MKVLGFALLTTSLRNLLLLRFQLGQPRFHFLQPHFQHFIFLARYQIKFGESLRQQGTGVLLEILGGTIGHRLVQFGRHLFKKFCVQHCVTPVVNMPLFIRHGDI
jgi:hypothetical protein